MPKKIIQQKKYDLDPNEIINDYRLAYKSRQVSLVGRREVLSGKAKFGIFGAGKELAQIALAKEFQKGDFRSGYYRDQTLMLAIKELKISEFFAQLYADADNTRELATGGRSMNAHFATRSLKFDGSWRNLMEIRNSSSDVSPTASQMPRLVGLAYASRLYRELEALKDLTRFSNNGNEVAFGTIGNASCAEGMFWEALNAIAVLKVPAVISIWDDDYGISVPNEYQLAKGLSELLTGFTRKSGEERGYNFFQVKAWDYPGLIGAYNQAVADARNNHVPAVLHVVEATQPQGHSTSGSHERYKSPERLQWEADHDCLTRFRNWVIENGFATPNDLLQYENEDDIFVEETRQKAWEDYKNPILSDLNEVASIFETLNSQVTFGKELGEIKNKLVNLTNPYNHDILSAIREVLIISKGESSPKFKSLIKISERINKENDNRYSTHLYSQSPQSADKIPPVEAVYSDSSQTMNGFEILNRAFDSILERDPRVVAFGEDLGKIGGVNQAFAGMQEKYGELRVSDTGIRETTILGQAIGLAMRGLRPIVEIQYLDYILYALQIMSDDLATLHWRTAGGQKAPVIIRTRGHRLEGIWHSGSPMAGIINLVQGIHVLVPRNMVQAAGFYNTLLKSDDPGLVVEVLNGYRLKERLPDNINDFSVPLGVPEVLREGEDITIVTYGPLCWIALESAALLDKVGISVEIIDIQSLLPFDVRGIIGDSLKKTNRILFLDEDVPGGTTAYMMQKVIEDQSGYYWLDSEPRTLSAKPHRPAYGSDGNYWSKPNIDSVFEVAYEMMHEVSPVKYPLFYKL